MRYEKQLGERMSLSLRGAYDASRYQGYWMYSMPTLNGERLDTDAARADWLSAETRLRLRFYDTHHFTLGLEGQAQLRVEQEVDPLGSGLVLSQPRGTFSAYVLDEWRLHPRLSLSAGLRVDRYFNNLKTLPFTPRPALIGRPYARGLTKLVVGSAFRAPTPFELDYQDNGRTQIAAGTLEPETITTLELEHAHNLTDELRLTVAGYANNIRHLVALSEQPGPPRCTGGPLGSMPCIVFVNRPGETRAFGAEAGLRWQPGRFILVDLNYSFVTLVNAAEKEANATPTHRRRDGCCCPWPMATCAWPPRPPTRAPADGGATTAPSMARRCCSTWACPGSCPTCATSPGCVTCWIPSTPWRSGRSAPRDPCPNTGAPSRSSSPAPSDAHYRKGNSRWPSAQNRPRRLLFTKGTSRPPSRTRSGESPASPRARCLRACTHPGLQSRGCSRSR
ncbi:TonB-dependent receptor plug domain-containing protein [Cystobacter fuscus]